jgi:glycosyltransferase 2 family protein
MLLAAVLLYLVLRGLDWSLFFTAFEQITFAFFPLLILALVLSYFFRAVRWKLLVQGSAPVPLGEVLWAKMTGYLGNLLLPARAGELVRAVYLSRKIEYSASFLLATCLAEGVIDVIALVVMGSFALFALRSGSGALQYANGILAAAGVLGLCVLLLLPRFGDPFVRFITGWRFLKDRHKAALVHWVNQFILGLQSLLRVRKILFFLMMTVLIWCTDALIVVVLGIALRMQVSFLQAIVLLTGLGLSSAVPSVPGYVGVYQFVAVAVLGPFGIPRENALALILVLQALNIIAVAVFGGIGLWRIRGSRSGPWDIPPPEKIIQ